MAKVYEDDNVRIFGEELIDKAKVSKRPPLVEAVANLGQLVNDARKTLSELRNRLNPVIRSEYEEEDEDDFNEKRSLDREDASPLMQDVQIVQRLTRDLINELNALMGILDV
jgi:hypothetical protein